ncbi:hypothetical protein MUP51_02685 [Candidatus Bathyarchaeota archaeon]|nr:hypothetical protein [Candidatus Bathyarchaeota archaeon]
MLIVYSILGIKFNNQGDISWYRVDALFLNKQSPYHEGIRIGETAYSQK